MSISNTRPPSFEADEDVRYVPAPPLRPLTDAQTRLILAYAVQAQRHERMEMRWVDERVVVQLVRTEDKRRE